MIKSKKLLMLLPAFALFAAACGGGDDNGAGDTVAPEETAGAEATVADSVGEPVDQTQGGDLTFYMITHSDDGPFWSVLKRGAQAAADAVGVELVWQGSNNDPGVQASDIEAAIAAGADGIAASLPSPDQLIPVLQDAVAAGIPVYTINSGVNDYQAIGAATHIGQTEFIAGQGAGLRFNDAGATKILCGGTGQRRSW